ncbi:unnamed protein product [Dovyalis caffra]|uniref:Kinesin motor domain-containing protein n=1 Tax=Dovyalis caffra TaxID=77055 RepID=A0AAV1SSX7_9ROSI|nr:unnamed protein product [Dovyalis caffra]
MPNNLTTRLKKERMSAPLLGSLLGSRIISVRLTCLLSVDRWLPHLRELQGTFGMGSTTEASSFQVTENPWDMSRVSGGSSGGPAAAVSAQQFMVSLDNDTFGSVRQRASSCEALDVDRDFLLRMSYLEIYNEDINDLLAPEHRKFGESHRHIEETDMNLYSSRSYIICRMIIESRGRTEDEDINNSCDAVRVQVLNLVDLVGSKHAAKTSAEALKAKGGHVQYRDSKLTCILQPTLGGIAITAIICSINLAQIQADETKRSL